MSRRRVLDPLAPLLVCAALALGACASEEEKFQQLLVRAAEYDEQGRVKEALLELRTALKLRPKDAEANYRIATLLQEQGQYADALFFYHETTRLDPTRLDAALFEAKLVLHDDTNRAAEIVRRALQLRPHDPIVHLRRSEVALAQADTGEALAAALTMIELDRESGHGYTQLGIVHQARIREAQLKGEVEDEDVIRAALDAFAKADEAYGGAFIPRIERGRLFSLWPGHRDEAAAEFRGAVEVARRDRTPEQVHRAARGVLAYARGAGDDELRRWALEETVAVDASDVSAWLELARLTDREGGSGEDVLLGLLAKRPQDIAAHVRYARYLLSGERHDEAVAHLQKVVDEGFAGARALAELVQIQLMLGRDADARATLQRLQSEYPDERLTALSRARFALDQRRPAEAAAILRKLTADYQQREALRLLAVSELQLRNLPAAVAAVDRAIELSPDDPPIALLQLKARIHHATGDWTVAMRTFRTLNRRGHRLEPDEQLMLARAFYGMNRPQAGQRRLERLLALDSPPTAAVLEYARQEGPKNPKRARALLAAAHESAPRDVPVFAALTELDQQSGRTELALKRLDERLAGDASPQPRLLALRAQLLMQFDRYDEAERDALAALEAAPNLPGLLNLLVPIYSAQGKLDEALKAFEQADEVGVLNPQMQVLLARLYLQTQNTDRAREMFEQALSQRSDLAGAKNDLAYLLAQDGDDLERALQLAQEAIQAVGENSDVVDTLGYVYHRKGLHEAAVQQFRFAIELAEKKNRPSPGYLFHLGLALRALDRHGEAVEAFERALSLGDDFPAAETLRTELEAARAAAQSEAETS